MFPTCQLVDVKMKYRIAKSHFTLVYVIFTHILPRDEISVIYSPSKSVTFSSVEHKEGQWKPMGQMLFASDVVSKVFHINATGLEWPKGELMMIFIFVGHVTSNKHDTFNNIIKWMALWPCSVFFFSIKHIVSLLLSLSKSCHSISMQSWLLSLFFHSIPIFIFLHLMTDSTYWQRCVLMRCVCTTRTCVSRPVCSQYGLVNPL